MITIIADKWTIKQTDSGWSLLRHGEPSPQGPDNCHVALAWKLAYASGQEELPELVLEWRPLRSDLCRAEIFCFRLSVLSPESDGFLWAWSLTGEGTPLDFGEATSLRDGQLKAEAALRRLVWSLLMPKEAL